MMSESMKVVVAGFFDECIVVRPVPEPDSDQTFGVAVGTPFTLYPGHEPRYTEAPADLIERNKKALATEGQTLSTSYYEDWRDLLAYVEAAPDEAAQDALPVDEDEPDGDSEDEVEVEPAEDEEEAPEPSSVRDTGKAVDPGNPWGNV